jgi:hypothetical protein
MTRWSKLEEILEGGVLLIVLSLLLFVNKKKTIVVSQCLWTVTILYDWLVYNCCRICVLNCLESGVFLFDTCSCRGNYG